MATYQPLQSIYRPASTPASHTLLLLHGTGGNERDLLPLAERFGTHFNVLSVRGNVLEHGMPRFFKRLSMGIFDEADVQFRTHELVDFVQNTATEKGFDVKNTVALGYSNGANIAGAILMLYPEFLAGAILWRAMLPLSNKMEFVTERQQPIFLSSGKHDPTVDPQATIAYEQLLAKNGFQVAWHDLPAGHQLTQSDIDLSVEWFETHFGAAK